MDGAEIIWNTRASDATAECLAGLLRQLVGSWGFNQDAMNPNMHEDCIAALAAYDAERKSIASDQRAGASPAPMHHVVGCEPSNGEKP